MADIVSVISQFVSLKRKGREYIGVCPFHEDTDPSLKVNPEKGIFKCFVCGKGGHVNSFLYEYNKLYHTNHKLDVKTEPIKTKSDFKDKLDDWKIITPVPNWVEQPSFRHFNDGVPSDVFRFTNSEGKTIFYTCRFNISKDEKQVRPYTYCTNGKIGKWMWKGLPDSRPLYGVNKFIKSTKPVVLVEGEGKVDVGYNSCDQFDFASWSGGANAYKLTDYSTLKGRDVILLQDNDPVGEEAMDGICGIISPFVNKVYRVAHMGDKPKAWDIKDQKWKKDELYNFIKSRILR